MHGQMFGTGLWAGNWLWLLFVGAIVVVPVWRICARTGYPGWLSLLALVPLANLFLLYFIAFAEWKTPQTESVNQRNPD